jgi:hypothetical protein
MDARTAQEVRMLEETQRWIEKSEAARRALITGLTRIVETLSPIDNASHAETAGRATEIAKALIAALSPTTAASQSPKPTE